MRATSKYLSRRQPKAEGSVQDVLRTGQASVRAAGWTALLAAALLGAGVAYADECSDEWADAPAQSYCDDSNDSVTVANVSGTTKCSVDIACYNPVNLLNGPNYDSLQATFYVTNPIEWQVWTDDDGNSNSSTNGLARTDVDDINICYYAGPLTGDTWVSWQDKLVVGSCASDEVDVADAVANGLDMRVSELE